MNDAYLIYDPAACAPPNGFGVLQATLFDLSLSGTLPPFQIIVSVHLTSRRFR